MDARGGLVGEIANVIVFAAHSLNLCAHAIEISNGLTKDVTVDAEEV